MLDPTKFCEHCGEQLVRKRYNGRLEDRGVFLRRVYCNLACSGAASAKDAPSVSALRKRATQFRGTSCELCGAIVNLHAHHIDGKPSNNCAENIQTLCGSCHASHHHRVRRAGQMVPGRAA